MNTVQLIGRLTADPKADTTPTGKSVCRIRLAVPGFNRDATPVFIDVEAWNKLAEACDKHLEKGRRVSVTGRDRPRPVANRGRPEAAAPLRRRRQRRVPRRPQERRPGRSPARTRGRHRLTSATFPRPHHGAPVNLAGAPPVLSSPRLAAGERPVRFEPAAARRLSNRLRRFALTPPGLVTCRLTRLAIRPSAQAAPAQQQRDAGNRAPGHTEGRAPRPQGGSMSTTTSAATAEPRLVSLEQIHIPEGANPRKRFDERALQELADSIGKHGVIQPLVVRTRRRRLHA